MYRATTFEYWESQKNLRHRQGLTLTLRMTFSSIHACALPSNDERQASKRQAHHQRERLRQSDQRLTPVTTLIPGNSQVLTIRDALTALGFEAMVELLDVLRSEPPLTK